MFEIFLYGRSYLQSRDNCPLNWSFCGDYYGPAGFSMHGPYELSGDKSLLVREYYRIPSEIWKLSTELPFESLKILQIFNGVKVYINFANRIANKQNITKSVSSAAVFVDGQQIMNTIELKKLIETVSNITKTQTDYVNGMDSLDVARKLSQLAYYIHKNFYLHFNNNWYPQETVDNTIKLLGRKFADMKPSKEPRTTEIRRKNLDPRNYTMP